MAQKADPLAVLTDKWTAATWANNGLPVDHHSLENGAIVANCARWPLLLDPSLQVWTPANNTVDPGP
eukprot:815364-Prorocentrum_minimum.AAC.1